MQKGKEGVAAAVVWRPHISGCVRGQRIYPGQHCTPHRTPDLLRFERQHNGPWWHPHLLDQRKNGAWSNSRDLVSGYTRWRDYPV